MKVNTAKKPLYSAYVLEKSSRQKLLSLFSPAYSRVVAHHITVRFGNVTVGDIPPSADIKVVGYANSQDGVEALVVSVDGETRRPDGSVYHITWSLGEGRKPVESNDVIQEKGFEMMVIPITIDTVPEVVCV